MSDLRVSFPKPCDELWEAMTPVGCDRVCARCDKVIHDLAHYTVDEVEALALANPDTCVRARVDASGAIALKPGRSGRARRMIAAVGASVGLLVTSTSVGAQDRRPTGAISGKLTYSQFKITVIATAADGTRYGAKVRRDGQYRIEGVPAGNYKLTFTPSCGEPWTLETTVAVGDAEAVVPDGPAMGECIIIGQLRIDSGAG